MDCQAGAVESLAPSFGGATGEKILYPPNFRYYRFIVLFPSEKWPFSGEQQKSQSLIVQLP
jgi:hypothetical protein